MRVYVNRYHVSSFKNVTSAIHLISKSTDLLVILSKIWNKIVITFLGKSFSENWLLNSMHIFYVSFKKRPSYGTFYFIFFQISTAYIKYNLFSDIQVLGDIIYSTMKCIELYCNLYCHALCCM